MKVEIEAQTLQKVVACLNTLEVKGVKNMAIVVGCANALEQALQAATTAEERAE